MNKPDIHLIALDLGGTLLNSKKQLSPRNLAALTRAAELGIEIVPATGRFYGGMPDFIRALPFLHYALTINGAQVCAVPNCDPIYRAEIHGRTPFLSCAIWTSGTSHMIATRKTPHGSPRR